MNFFFIRFAENNLQCSAVSPWRCHIVSLVSENGGEINCVVKVLIRFDKGMASLHLHELHERTE